MKKNIKQDRDFILTVSMGHLQMHTMMGFKCTLFSLISYRISTGDLMASNTLSKCEESSLMDFPQHTVTVNATWTDV